MAGQAKLRGNFEQRKAQAIAEGRAKEMKIDVKVRRRRRPTHIPDPHEIMLVGNSMAGCAELTRTIAIMDALHSSGLLIVGK